MFPSHCCTASIPVECYKKRDQILVGYIINSLKRYCFNLSIYIQLRSIWDNYVTQFVVWGCRIGELYVTWCVVWWDAGLETFTLLNVLCGDAGLGNFTLLNVVWGCSIVKFTLLGVLCGDAGLGNFTLLNNVVLGCRVGKLYVTRYVVMQGWGT